MGLNPPNLKERRRPVVVDAQRELGLALVGPARLQLDDGPQAVVALEHDGGGAHEARHLQAHQVVHCREEGTEVWLLNEGSTRLAESKLQSGPSGPGLIFDFSLLLFGNSTMLLTCYARFAATQAQSFIHLEH